MNYIKAERLKFKHALSNKIIILIPLLTIFGGHLFGGYVWFQASCPYFWYFFMVPGTIGLLAIMSYKKEQSAGKYFSVLSSPIDLQKFQFTKSIVIAEKIFIASIILAFVIIIVSIFDKYFYADALSYPDLRDLYININPITMILSMLGITLGAIWQIPLCLLLAKKAGLLIVICNLVLGMTFPTLPLFSGNHLWILCPYTYPAKFAEYALGIHSSGTFIGEALISLPYAIVIIVLSIVWFILLALLDSKLFLSREVK